MDTKKDEQIKQLKMQMEGARIDLDIKFKEVQLAISVWGNE